MPPPPEFDPYRVLGVPRTASAAEIGRAHRRLAKGAHPDLHGPDADARMRAINRAWHLLSDPARRAAWDRAHGINVIPAEHWPGPMPPRPAPTSTWRPEPAATWEAQPAGAGGRVGARPAPERRPAGAAPSVRDSGWLAAAVGGVLVLVVIVLGAVAAVSRPPTSLDQLVAEAGLRAANTVALDGSNALVIAEPETGQLEAMHFFQGSDGRWREGQRTQVMAVGDNTVAVMAWDGVGRGGPWRSFVFGRSAPDVDRVVLPDRGVGTETFHGTWGIGLADGALTVPALRWEFQAADGTVLLEGSGELGDLGG